MRLTEFASTISALRIREARLTRSRIGANEDKYRCIYRKRASRAYCEIPVSTRISFTLEREMSLRDKRFTVSNLSGAPRAIDFFKDARLPGMCRSQSSDDAQYTTTDGTRVSRKGSSSWILRGTYAMYCNFYLFRACYVHFVYRTTSTPTRFNGSLAYSDDDDKGGVENEAAYSCKGVLPDER